MRAELGQVGERLGFPTAAHREDGTVEAREVCVSADLEAADHLVEQRPRGSLLSSAVSDLRGQQQRLGGSGVSGEITGEARPEPAGRVQVALPERRPRTPQRGLWRFGEVREVRKEEIVERSCALVRLAPVGGVGRDHERASAEP